MRACNHGRLNLPCNSARFGDLRTGFDAVMWMRNGLANNYFSVLPEIRSVGEGHASINVVTIKMRLSPLVGSSRFLIA